MLQANDCPKDRELFVDFLDFGVPMKSTMPKHATKQYKALNLIERSLGLKEMKWRTSWPVWPFGWV